MHLCFKKNKTKLFHKLVFRPCIYISFKEFFFQKAKKKTITILKFALLFFKIIEELKYWIIISFQILGFLSPLGHNATPIVLFRTNSYLPKLVFLHSSISIQSEMNPNLFQAFQNPLLEWNNPNEACKYYMGTPRHFIASCLLLLLWRNFIFSSLVSMFELCFHLKKGVP